ncbi:virulence RhuM family protein [Candidatus Roizmanbacteria bacterium]|nr:virulence RhuM family protein [Candidatus Roizmanbacteria bacterium]
MKKIPDNQITFYQSPDGSVNIEVLYAEENIWLTQKKIAELFDVERSVITKHLKNIFADNELDQNSVSAKFAHTAEDGKVYQTQFYSLEAIIAVGYRVSSERGTQFRQWATGILKKNIHKGYALDSNRMKYGSRFSTRYFDELYEEIRDIRTSERMMYQKITNRVSSKKVKMGLTSWCKFPNGKIMPSDVIIAKNYLDKKELTHLNRIGNMYLDYAEIQAARGRAMTMKDWIEKLNAFLKFSEYEILTNAGKISHEVAETLALGEYEKYKKTQDKNYISDFDREVKKLIKGESKTGSKIKKNK